jgi:hypothetical protein
MFFLTIRFAVSLVAGISCSARDLSVISYFFALFFLASLILIYKDNKLGIYLFTSITIIELLLYRYDITNTEFIPRALLFWRVFGIYLAYKTYIETNEKNILHQ